TGSRPVYLEPARSSAIAFTSRMWMPQKSAICSKLKPVLSTSQLAVACGINGVGLSWATAASFSLRLFKKIVFQKTKNKGRPLRERPVEPFIVGDNERVGKIFGSRCGF